MSTCFVAIYLSFKVDIGRNERHDGVESKNHMRNLLTQM